jgi:hypothetical protein
LRGAGIPEEESREKKDGSLHEKIIMERKSINGDNNEISSIGAHRNPSK